MAWYFDTSALTKLIAPEAESEALRKAVSDGSWIITTSALSLAELRRAAQRRGSAELAAARALLSSAIDWFDLTESILTTAGELEPPLLRTLDAIHVAAARSLGDACDGLITYDRRMREAARVAGLTVLAPGQD